MRHEYYKLHAFVAGGLLAIVLAVEKLELVDTKLTTIVAIPVILYLLAATIMTYKTFKESKVSHPDLSKEQAKLEKKRLKVLKKLAKKSY